MQYSGEVSQNTIIMSSISGRSVEAMEWIVPPSREDDLIDQAQHGELDAFNELVLLYQDLVYRQALWMLHEEEAAEDATQDTFLKAFQKIHTFIPQRSFRAWLLKIVTNHCLDIIRASYRHPNLPLEPTNSDGEEMEPYWLTDPGDTPEKAFERAETEGRISRAIQRLAPKYQTVVILADLQELDYAEVTAILGVPLGTMKSRLARARRLLQQDLLMV